MSSLLKMIEDTTTKEERIKCTPGCITKPTTTNTTNKSSDDVAPLVKGHSSRSVIVDFESHDNNDADEEKDNVLNHYLQAADTTTTVEKKEEEGKNQEDESMDFETSTQSSKNECDHLLGSLETSLVVSQPTSAKKARRDAEESPNNSLILSNECVEEEEEGQDLELSKSSSAKEEVSIRIPNGGSGGCDDGTIRNCRIHAANYDDYDEWNQSSSTDQQQQQQHCS